MDLLLCDSLVDCILDITEMKVPGHMEVSTLGNSVDYGSILSIYVRYDKLSVLKPSLIKIMVL
jgi:hypothetical protein